MASILHDVRYALRMLTKNPGFTIVAVLTLALGIGTTTAIFSMVNCTILQPLAFPESDRLVCLREVILEVVDKYPTVPVSARHFVEWQDRCQSFESISIIDPDTANLTKQEEPERLKLIRASTNLFDTLGIQAVQGRCFIKEEGQEGQNNVVVISHGFWRRKFGGDSSIVGHTISLDNQSHTVIGVLPEKFRFPNMRTFDLVGTGPDGQPDVYTPKVFSENELKQVMGMFNYGAVARLKHGVTQEAALVELNGVAAQLIEMATEKMSLRGFIIPLKESIIAQSRRGLFVLLGAIGAVLLIACLNLAILILARTEQRSFESAVRKALGAGRMRLLRQSLTEMVIIALLGGMLGILLAGILLGTLVKIAPADIPRLDEVQINSSVLLFALSITMLTALLFGFLPAWRMANTHPENVLRAGGRSATTTSRRLNLRSVLVTTEVGFGVILLMLAGLLFGSFMHIINADKGYQANTVLAVDLTLPRSTYSDRETRENFFRQLLDNLSSTPGVKSTALVNALPLTGETWVDLVWTPDEVRPVAERPSTNVRFISQDYFKTMGIPLHAGRIFDERDKERKVAVISERLAQKLWPQETMAVGRVFVTNETVEYEVIGVVGDVRANIDKAPAAIFYRPYWDTGRTEAIIVAQTQGDPYSIAGPVKSIIHDLDADMPIPTMRTMHEVLDDSVAQQRFQMMLASAFAASALLLAALGIYGVLSYSVAQRTREIGIRLAFGAPQINILGMVIRQGMIPVMIGAVTGLITSLALGRLLASLLYELSPYDPLTITAVTFILLVVAFTTCLLPARRAAGTDPMEAIRYE